MLFDMDIIFLLGSSFGGNSYFYILEASGHYYLNIAAKGFLFFLLADLGVDVKFY